MVLALSCERAAQNLIGPQKTSCHQCILIHPGNLICWQLDFVSLVIERGRRQRPVWSRKRRQLKAIAMKTTRNRTSDDSGSRAIRRTGAGEVIYGSRVCGRGAKHSESAAATVRVGRRLRAAGADNGEATAARRRKTLSDRGLSPSSFFSVNRTNTISSS
jgi:hypothetical protein